jgi:hypothetical protein
MGCITSLDLSFCEAMDDEGLAALAAGNPGLRHVCLTSCTAVTDAGVGALVSRARGITSLCLEMCRVSDVGVQSAARGLALTSMSVGSCPRVSNVGIQIIASHGRRLGKLDLSGCACVLRGCGRE